MAFKIYTEFDYQEPEEFVRKGVRRVSAYHYEVIGSYLYQDSDDLMPLIDNEWMIETFDTFAAGHHAAWQLGLVAPSNDGDVIWQPVDLPMEDFIDMFRDFLKLNDWCKPEKDDFVTTLLPGSDKSRGTVVINNDKYVLFPSVTKITYDFVPDDLKLMKIETSPGWDNGEFQIDFEYYEGQSDDKLPEPLTPLWSQIFHYCTSE